MASADAMNSDIGYFVGLTLASQFNRLIKGWHE
jgi:hypothetical protein